MYKFFIICLVEFSFIYGQYIPSYIESSNGLNNPEMEGGRTELELADVNGDGHLDILSIGDHGSPFVNTQQHGIMVWFGNGMGGWSVYQNGNFGYGGIAAGDVNNDGFLDVGYGMHHNYSGYDFGDQLIEVALGDGTGLNWTPWDNGLAVNGEDWGMFCTDFADIDCDGDLDIGSNSFGCCSGLHVYKNLMDGTWIQSFGFLGGNSSMDFIFGDVNNDGYPDIAAAQGNGSVYLNDGTGNFVLSLSGYRNGPDLGDIDNDGTEEISFVNSNDGVEVWKWNEGNIWTSISSGLPASGGYEATQIFDMNTDGFADIAAFGNGVVTVWLGNGTGSWSQAAQFNLPSPGDYQAFRIEGDADHNGYPDIALVDEEGTWVNYQNHLRFFKENSPADSLTIHPVYPSHNRKVKENSVQNIKWISEVPAGDTSWIKLELSINDTIGPWQLIADGLANNGSYQWIIPDSSASYNICRIRYTVYTLTDSASEITAGGFNILGEPIPVELVSFTAIQNGSEILLSWTTATETNNKSFEVQKKVPDDYYNTIGLIEGSNTTTEPMSYTFTDKDIAPGNYTYRLKQIDYNGTFDYSNEISINVNIFPGAFKLYDCYPNPFNNSTRIEFDIPYEQMVDLKIYNILGEEIAELINEVLPSGKYEKSWDASFLSSGIYYYRLTAGGNIETKKMSLMK